MSEPRPEEQSPPAVEPWWFQDDEPEYLVLPESGRDVPDTVRREPIVRAVAARVGPLERLAGRMATELDGVRTELSAFASEVRHELAVLRGALDADRTESGDLSATVDESRRELETALERARAEAAGQTAALGGRLDELEAALGGAVGEAVAEVGGTLREAAGAVESSIEQASRAMGEDHAATMEEFERRFATAVRPVGEGLARIERLASVIEAMGKRRGFQKLVRSERALREEQSDMVRTLGEAGADVRARVAAMGERMRHLEERLEGLSQDAVALKELPARATEAVAGAVERLRGELATSLERRFDEEVRGSVERLRAELEAGLPVKEAVRRLRDVASAQEHLARTQRSFDGVASSLRAEIRSLRDRIQSWGKPRTAPRLAREVDDLGARLAGLEEEIRNGIAESVAEKVTERLMATPPETPRRRRRSRTT